MAESYGFFDGDNYYGEEEFNRYFRSLFRSGVSTNEMTGALTLPVTKQSDTVFRVGPGFAILDGYYYVNTANVDLTVSRASGSTAQTTRIYVGVDKTNKTISVYTRSASGSGWEASIAPVRDDTRYEVSLARITDSGGTVTLIDERANGAVCGALRPRNLTGLDELLAYMQGQFDAWFAQQQATGWRNIYIQDSQPSSPVAGSIWFGGETLV